MYALKSTALATASKFCCFHSQVVNILNFHRVVFFLFFKHVNLGRGIIFLSDCFVLWLNTVACVISILVFTEFLFVTFYRLMFYKFLCIFEKYIFCNCFMHDSIIYIH